MVIEAVVFDEHLTMPLATRFDDWMGIQDNCFSIPVVVGRSGIIRHLHPEMNDDEQQNRRTAAAAVKSTTVSLQGSFSPENTIASTHRPECKSKAA